MNKPVLVQPDGPFTKKTREFFTNRLILYIVWWFDHWQDKMPNWAEILNESDLDRDDCKYLSALTFHGYLERDTKEAMVRYRLTEKGRSTECLQERVSVHLAGGAAYERDQKRFAKSSEEKQVSSVSYQVKDKKEPKAKPPFHAEENTTVLVLVNGEYFEVVGESGQEIQTGGKRFLIFGVDEQYDSLEELLFD